ncbi:hypothetical protein [Amycolatopsis sp. NPDC051903]|uniref:hypothetical protein n=1 Tax=Amycolatopsis sp. NPDC051903 TaxID=3363936 RepID=UPI0037AD10BF
MPLDDLLGVLVHPPAPPEEPRWWRPDVWVRAVQVMACLGISWHRLDQPWRGSERARVLSELCFGPEDWVTEAAAFAMVAAAWMDPQLRQDVGATVAVRWSQAEKASHRRAVTILSSLTELVLACPWLGDQVGDVARALRAHLRSAEPEPVPEDRIKEFDDIARSHAPGHLPRRLFGFGHRSPRE